MMLEQPPSRCELPSQVCIRQRATASQERVDQGNKRETKIPTAVRWIQQRLTRVVTGRVIVCAISRFSQAVFHSRVAGETIL